MVVQYFSTTAGIYFKRMFFHYLTTAHDDEQHLLFFFCHSGGMDVSDYIDADLFLLEVYNFINTMQDYKITL